MKKILVCLIVIIGLLTITGCGKDNNKSIVILKK